MEPLAQGEVRIGMESWMVGRQVMVFQHPACFWRGLQVTSEASGRGRCKQSKQSFSVGERRITAQAHTSVAHLKLDVAPALLQPVLQAAVAASADYSGARTIEGFELLAPAERSAFEAALGDRRGSRAPATEPTAAKADDGDVAETATTAEVTSKSPPAAQPAAGYVSRATGRVVWRFAGSLCYGKLLPAQESKTHCYARTHKGNTKTLVKGSSSWWLDESA
eukprot:5953932-Prymnesium_polylepis.1